MVIRPVAGLYAALVAVLFAEPTEIIGIDCPETGSDP